MVIGYFGPSTGIIQAQFDLFLGVEPVADGFSHRCRDGWRKPQGRTHFRSKLAVLGFVRLGFP